MTNRWCLGIANPIATILSVSMMLRYSFGLKREADALDAAVETTLDSKDIGGLELRTGYVTPSTGIWIRPC